MPTFGPVSRRDLIRHLRTLGFEGPFPGGKHAFMRRRDLDLRLPNSHEGDIGRNLLARILKQAGLSREEWEGA